MLYYNTCTIGNICSYIRCVDVQYESKREEEFYDVQVRDHLSHLFLLCHVSQLSVWPDCLRLHHTEVSVTLVRPSFIFSFYLVWSLCTSSALSTPSSLPFFSFSTPFLYFLFPPLLSYFLLPAPLQLRTLFAALNSFNLPPSFLHFL
jgi:hypothetical protein